MKTTLLMLLWLLSGIELTAQTIVQEILTVGGSSHVSDMDLKEPTREGSTIIVMPGPLSPGVRVLGITDNAPGGSNVYQPVPGAASSCKASLDIWYCEKCKPGVKEMKYHFSGHVPSINVFLEVSNLALTSALDGSGVNVSDGTSASEGVEAGPSITTTATDFIVARYFSADPAPTGVSPAEWNYKTTYIYKPNAPAGTHQPKLTGGGPSAAFCMSMAAFKAAAANPAPSTSATKAMPGDARPVLAGNRTPDK